MSINKDEVKGQVNQTVGKVKEVIGHATGDTELEVKGDAQQAVGIGQKAVGKLKDTLKETIKSR